MIRIIDWRMYVVSCFGRVGLAACLLRLAVRRTTIYSGECLVDFVGFRLRACALGFRFGSLRVDVCAFVVGLV